ncbi:MAG: RDD family protein [Pseudomonadota bacterium]
MSPPAWSRRLPPTATPLADPAPAAPLHAGVVRVLSAAAYDGLLLLALLMVLTATLQLLTHGEAITRARVGAWEYAYRALLLVAVGAYYGIACTRRGQTLGMKAWHLRLERPDGSLPGWRAVALRLTCAGPLYLALIAGIALYMAREGGWLLLCGCALPLMASHAWDTLTGGGTLPDRVSGTRVVRVSQRH